MISNRGWGGEGRRIGQGKVDEGYILGRRDLLAMSLVADWR